MKIVYATQTGTSEYYAQQTARRIKDACIISIDEFDFTTLPDCPRLVFIISTTGDGDIPTQMQSFWRFLLIKDLPKNSLNKVEFSVFGLGDSSYPKFNYAGRKLRSRLIQLSAKEFIPSSFGDEQHPCAQDTEFIPWLYDLQKICGVQTQEIKFIQLIHLQECQPLKPQLNFKFLKKKLLSAPNHTKETYQFIFQCDQQYNVGDILNVKPKNNKILVEKFLSLNNLEKQTVINLKCQSQKLPNCLTLETLFTDYFNLTSPPSRHFIQIMSKYAELQVHKDKLIIMCQPTPEGLEEYYSYVCREKRNPVEVLYDFQPCIIPLEELLDCLPIIRSRSYSISSVYDKNSISITVALVQYTTGKNRIIKGFCSDYLNNLQENSYIESEIIKGSVKFPNDPSIPIIMVGPGTGVAPFIGLIQQRINSLEEKEKTILFFGSCYKEKEFYYKEFLENAPILLFTAFSRDQQQKIYVQHKILEQREFIKKIVMNNLNQIMIVITGTSRKMPSQVEQVFKEILGDNILQELKQKRQYLVECW